MVLFALYRELLVNILIHSSRIGIIDMLIDRLHLGFVQLIRVGLRQLPGQHLDLLFLGPLELQPRAGQQIEHSQLFLGQHFGYTVTPLLPLPPAPPQSRQTEPARPLAPP
jgi:hypothetical protein